MLPSSYSPRPTPPPLRLGGGLKTWLRRLQRFPQLDFELAAWQLTYLCIAPRRVYVAPRRPS